MDMQNGAVVHVRVAVMGGAIWKQGRIIRAYPRSFGRRAYDVLCSDGTMVINAADLSLQPMAKEVA